MHWIAEAAGRTPRAVLAALVGLHVALWGLIPAWVQPNLPLDMIEGLAWGHEWQWAYFKHPPLPPWITEVAAQLAQGWDRPLFFLGPLAMGVALLLIWRLARDIVGPRVALLAVLLQEGVLYFTFFASEFNHTLGQLPVWALIGWFGRRAILSRRTIDWLGLAVAGVLGMMTKYSTALILVTLALFLLFEPTARQRLKTIGPWLALVAMAVLLIPHLAGVAAIHFQPFDYPFARAGEPTAWYDHLINPARFAVAQFADILGALLLGVLLYRSPSASTPPPTLNAFDRRYVACLCWGPFLIAVVADAVLGVRFKDMWGAPMWNYLGLFIVVFLIRKTPAISRAFVAGWFFIFGAGLILYAAQFPGQALLGVKPLRSQFPSGALAAAIDRGWHDAVGAKPLRYVVGDTWLAGNVAFGSWHERPSVLIDGDWSRGPWVDAHRFRCDGGVLLWHEEADATRQTLLAGFKGAEIQPAIVLPEETHQARPFHIGRAILRPTPGCN